MKPPKEIWVHVNDSHLGGAYTAEQHADTIVGQDRRVRYILADQPKREPLYWVLKDTSDGTYRGDYEWSLTRDSATRYTKLEAQNKIAEGHFIPSVRAVPVYRKEKP